MDEDLKRLEAELGRLRPAELRPAYEERLEGALARRPGWPNRWLWVALPAAAVLALVLGWPHRPPPPRAPDVAAAPSGSFKPVDVRDVLVSSRDEGTVVLADGRPARRLLEAHLDTIVWRSPETAASIKWSVPREELKIVPIVYQ
jgi:hypothetical protein